MVCAGPNLQALLLERVKPVVAKFDASVDKHKDFKEMGTKMSDRDQKSIQLLHIVIGGELVDPNRTEFKDLSNVDFVGAYASFADAQAAWKGALAAKEKALCGYFFYGTPRGRYRRLYVGCQTRHR